MGIKDLFSGGISKVLDSAKGVIGQFVADPAEKAKAIQELENEANRHQEAGIKEANELEKAYLLDVQDSRNANARIQESDKASWWAKNTAYFLDVFVGLIWGTMTLFLIAKALNLVDNVNADLTAVLSIYTTVTAIFMISMNFHRGSSAGSKAKGDQLERMSSK